jgi:periplasmic copper chaperone A
MRPVTRQTIMPIGIAIGCVAFAAIASAHVVLDVKSAKIGSPLRATFTVGHGCSGSSTIKLRVRIPAGAVAVQPEAKSGWDLKTITEPYDHPYSDHGATLKEGVTEVAWSGLLPAHEAGKFAMTFDISDSLVPNQKLYFPVVQECQKGTVRWIDTADESAEFPAPSLLLLAGH